MTISIIESKQTQELQEYQVFMDLKAVLSVNVAALSHEDAQYQANVNLNTYNIQQAFITFLKENGLIITPDVHDVDIQVGKIYEEDE